MDSIKELIVLEMKVRMVSAICLMTTIVKKVITH